MSDGFLKDFDSCLRGFNSKAKKLEKYSKDFLILISYNIRGNQNLRPNNKKRRMKTPLYSYLIDKNGYYI